MYASEVTYDGFEIVVGDFLECCREVLVATIIKWDHFYVFFSIFLIQCLRIQVYSDEFKVLHIYGVCSRFLISLELMEIYYALNFFFIYFVWGGFFYIELNLLSILLSRFLRIIFLQILIRVFIFVLDFYFIFSALKFRFLSFFVWV